MADSVESADVLAIDDEPNVLLGLRITLNLHGINSVKCCSDSREALGLVRKSLPGVVLLDLTMPYLTGENLLQLLSQEFPELPVIIITGTNEVETAVACMRRGAYDYMVKPVEESRLVSGVRRALQVREMERELQFHCDRLTDGGNTVSSVFSEFTTCSPSLRAIFGYLDTVARTSKPLLITGETGTGKELIARAFHRLMGETRPFVAINVAGLDDELFSDTLFGHTRGAFTGAVGERKGLVEQAAGGILFLDEIGDLSAASQIKLLRLLQDGTFLPVGADIPKRSSARIVVATNRDLSALQSSGGFRRDLYYRLHTHHVHLPPLRDRKCDVPLLLTRFIERASSELSCPLPRPSREVLQLLESYDFPGNIRELEALAYEAVSLSSGGGMLNMQPFIDRIGSLSSSLSMSESALATVSTNAGRIDIGDSFPTLHHATNVLIDEAMRRSGGNQARAAKLLGISPQALSKRLKTRTI